MRTATGAKPFVKWAGGKQSISRSLAQVFPPKFGRFYEPFVGGGSVLLTVCPPVAVVSDFNDWLVDCYHAIRDDWQRVASILDTYPNTKNDFIRIRAIDPGQLDLFSRAAQFIYLNKTCFRGLFRVNQKGQFNVPYGEYQRAYYDPVNLARVAVALKRVEFRTGDFELCLHDVSSDDFIYLDPPYYKLGGFSDFNRYTKGQFREQDHFRLAALCRELDGRGVRWAMSNSDTEFVRQLFKGFEIREVTNRREINLRSQERSITELLIANYELPKNQLTLFPEDEEPLPSVKRRRIES